VDIAPAVFGKLVWTQSAGGMPWAFVPLAIGITTASPVRYLAGAGLQFGGRARVNLMGGAAWGTLDVPNGMSADQHLPPGKTSLELKSVMRTGAWGAVTFTVTLPKKSP